MTTSRGFAISFAVVALLTLGACEQKPHEPKKPAAPAPEVAQNTPPPAPAPAPAPEASAPPPAPQELPKTASPYPVIGLGGMFSLGMFALVRAFRLR